jgi:hypothetical protein
VDRRGGVDEVAQLRGGGVRGSWPARRALGAHLELPLTRAQPPDMLAAVEQRCVGERCG